MIATKNRESKGSPREVQRRRLGVADSDADAAQKETAKFNQRQEKNTKVLTALARKGFVEVEGLCFLAKVSCKFVVGTFTPLAFLLEQE